MDPTEIRKMRINQILLSNGIILSSLIIFFVIIEIFTIRTTHFFFALGVFILIQAIYGFSKGDSKKSFIPILEKVAIYEKQKMGSEWLKTRKVSNVSNIVLSAVMFLQFYVSLDLEDNVFQFEPLITLIMLCLIIVVLNTAMLLHFRKVDHSTSVSDIKGYTWKSSILALIAGIVLSFIMSVVTIYFIFS